MSEKSKYVLRTGVLAWGVSLFLLSKGWGLLVDRASRPQTTSHFIFWTLIDLLIWLLVGAIFGLGMWSVRERQKAGDKKPSST
jgi:heme/copper-type cytochrome/quinol oxidase subunit 2